MNIFMNFFAYSIWITAKEDWPYTTASVAEPTFNSSNVAQMDSATPVQLTTSVTGRVNGYVITNHVIFMIFLMLIFFFESAIFIFIFC